MVERHNRLPFGTPKSLVAILLVDVIGFKYMILGEERRMEAKEPVDRNLCLGLFAFGEWIACGIYVLQGLVMNGWMNG